MIYYACPVAPSRLVPDSDFVDTVLREYHVRRVLMPGFLTNEYAAVPSLHFGWDLVIGLATWHAFPNVIGRTFATVMPALMPIAIVLSANHFILDAVAGAIVVAAGALLAIGLKTFGMERFQENNALHEGLRWLLGILSHPEPRPRSAPA